ncbi:PP2C family protein-serine/threonine phosphatase [Costertonia aggregata]|uniref:Serine/threonine-protein phosphatase n=1 Tax=Costertonia aggregata TaxID=343403 RepID=A0A7H9ANT7_9FLAO|nr:protein phosphatase 2C domain-containing protein [Costertonia aggregata]QLG45064.1 serine/threonine-protein phosphatase [Costertonia aggregata]
MKLFQPEYLNELGERTNNEDAVYPVSPNKNDTVFLVCDGVGGQAKGAVASKLICEHFPVYLKKASNNVEDDKLLEKGLRYVEEQLRHYANNNPDSLQMASTLTIICFSKKGNSATLGWVGDSRIYHIRNGGILFQTKDHSHVQSLLEMGEISEEEAKTHPKKNVITRAVNGKTQTRIATCKIDDIVENDFFLLCSDGILENLDNEKINIWFRTNAEPITIRNQIQKSAKGKTKDNYSMYLIKIKESNKAGQKDKKRFWNFFY